MKNFEEELYLRVLIVNEQNKRIATQRELREKYYRRAMPFEVDIKVTADYLKALRENQEAEQEVNQRLRSI
jgi:hypothetical protein